MFGNRPETVQLFAAVANLASSLAIWIVLASVDARPGRLVVPILSAVVLSLGAVVWAYRYGYRRGYRSGHGGEFD